VSKLHKLLKISIV